MLTPFLGIDLEFSECVRLVTYLPRDIGKNRNTLTFMSQRRPRVQFPPEAPNPKTQHPTNSKERQTGLSFQPQELTEELTELRDRIKQENDRILSSYILQVAQKTLQLVMLR